MTAMQFNLVRAGNVLAIVKEHPNEEVLAITDLDDAGASYHAYGFYPEAEACYSKVIQLKNLRGMQDESYLNTLRRLAILYRLQHKFAEAEHVYLQAINLAKALFGAVHLKVAEQNNYLAGLYLVGGRLEDAIRVASESNDIYAKIEGKESPNVGACHFALALICSKAGKKADASNHFNRAQIIMSSFVSEANETISNGLFGMAMYYYRQNDLESAEALFRHSIVLREESLWPFHPLVTKTLLQLGTFYETQALKEKAELCYLSALEKQRAAFGEEHPSLLDALTKLAALNARRGDDLKAKDCARQILNLKDSES